MSFPYKTIGVVAKTKHPLLPDLMRKIVDWTKADGCRFLAIEPIPDFPQIAQVDRETFQDESDLIMILVETAPFWRADVSRCAATFRFSESI